ncbi:MAG: hypothetical protein V1856_02455 [Candidatus Liptonbacteria bacterium]
MKSEIYDMKHDLMLKSDSMPGASRFFPLLVSRKGQALVEALVAMGVLSIGFMGIFQLLSQSLALNRVVSDNYVASYLAGEGIEIIKNIIDSNIIAGGASNWKSGLAAGSYEVQYDSVAPSGNQNRNLNYNPTTHLYGYGPGRQTGFRRVVIIESLNNREMRVRSRVTWSARGGGSSQVEAEDHFYNWRP